MCTVCNSDANRTSSTPDCLCATGYYDNDSGCPACNVRCGTCEDTSDNCLSCGGANRKTDFPTCGCLAKYYDDSEGADCIRCEVENCDECNPEDPT